MEQRKMNAMKTLICRLDANVPLYFHVFSELISNNLASILQSFSLVYSEPCQAAKIESFARIVKRKNSIPTENQ